MGRQQVGKGLLAKASYHWRMQYFTLAAIIREYRRERKLSQGSLAAALGRDRTWVAHLERGVIRPTAAQLAALARALECDLEDLLEYGEPRPEPECERDGNTKRLVLKRFAGAWEEDSGETAEFWRNTRLLEGLLQSLTADEAQRNRLRKLGLVQRQALRLANHLLQCGGKLARVAPAQLGFPMPIIDHSGKSINHLPRYAVVYAQGRGAIVMFGALCARWPVFLPSVVAVSAGGHNRFFTVDAPCVGPMPARHQSILDFVADSDERKRQALLPGFAPNGRVYRWGEQFTIARLTLALETEDGNAVVARLLAETATAQETSATANETGVAASEATTAREARATVQQVAVAV